MKRVKVISIYTLFIIGIVFTAGCLITNSPRSIAEYKKYYTNDTSLFDSGGVKITYLGVTSLLLDDGQTQLLLDCFFSRPSFIRTATSRISTDTSCVNTILSQYKMNRLKAIFISHSHYDHSFDAAYVAKKTNATLYGSQSTLNIGKGGGLSGDQISLFEPGKEQLFGDFSVTVISSEHSTATSLNDDLGEMITKPLAQPAKASKYVEGGTFDFLIKHKGHIIFIKPSANYITGKLKDLKADVLFLGVGRLGKQDRTFMDNYYQETVGMLKPMIVIPVHWDNFFEPLSNNLEMLPKLLDQAYKGFDFLIDKTKSDNIEFKLLQGGKSIVLFQKNN